MQLRLFAQYAVIAGMVARSCLAAGDLRLIEAVKDQNRQALALLIQEHADVNAAQPDGATPLSWAVYLDQPDSVDALMKAGAKVNTADEYGETPLTLACGTGNAAIIAKLLDVGADANAARWDGETALMIAARSGSMEGLKLLLAHGANVNAVESRKGQNALMWAAAEGHSDVVDFLIRNGADVKAVSKGGFTPLVFAAQKGDAKSVSTLLAAGLDVNYKIPAGESVLQIAVTGGKTRAAQVLLEKGADPNAFDPTINAPLHVAARAGNLEIVTMLLQKGAHPNVQTAKTSAFGRAGGGGFRAPAGEQTPLLLAARANHEDVMRALVAGGADAKMKAQDGTTLLMAAASSGHIGPVKYAYELDPEIKAVTNRKSDVMHAAVIATVQSTTQPITTQADICEVIQFLADKGADLDALDARGQTAMTIANVIPIDKAVQLLTKLIVASGNTPKQPDKR
jgi:ankyrin repeat protein